VKIEADETLHWLQGFARVRSSLAEEALDWGPCARDVFARMMQAGISQGWLVLDPEV
jgi:hypothetical protein